MTRLRNISAFIVVSLLGGCSSVTNTTQDIRSAPEWISNVMGRDASIHGFAVLREQKGGARLTIEVRGLPAGLHGLHLHEKGLCEGPAFASAGGHWNPTAKMHGRENPAGAHLGDLPNLEIDTSGTATISLPVPSMAAMADLDGTSLVIHAKYDDYRTDPSGNSGDRIACAVIAAPRQT